MSFKNSQRITISVFGMVALLVAFVSVAQALYEIEIDVSPNVLNLQNQGEVVTVHTDISYSAVVGSTVTLNDVEISHWKSDNRGNFVAKFVMEEIKDLPLNIGELNTLTLIGETSDGIQFSGSQDILVVNNIPKK